MSEHLTVTKKPLIGLSMEDLELFARSLGHQSFRGRQLFDWIYRKNVYDYSEMSDLPISLREKLSDIPLHPLKMVNNDVSTSKQTQKYLFELESGEKIESVLMVDGKRVTICLSTQVGCAVDCDFCATGKMGFIQNLTAGEILDQFLQLQKIIEKKITNVVFMGMGEPFLNYNNSILAADLLHHPKGINMGAWRITISTAGITKKIKQFANDAHPYKLAVSLNGSNQEQRLMTMPITKTQSFSELLEVSQYYTHQTRKRVTFEYVLMAGVNDDTVDAKNLKEILAPINCKLNLIPYNEINGPYRRPSDTEIKLFISSLKNASFPVTVRWSKGQDIDAGCGQLATVSEVNK
tara:strand:+ start:2120 stop:3169 length:1050 start_codon:yes stop_codon:yes gene_type:complete